MGKSKKYIQKFIAAKKSVMDFFGCEGNFYIKPLLDYNWSCKSNNDFFILSYQKDDEPTINAVVVKKNGEPMIYKTEEYTMVIAIDCVKTAFIFKNQLI